MFKKELREIGKPVFLRLAVMPLLLLLPMLQLVGSEVNRLSFMRNLFILTFAVVLFWIAVHIGASIFKSEYEDRALEYFLTFPVSRMFSIAQKMLVRVLVILLLSGFYLIAVRGIAVWDPGMRMTGYFLFNPALLPLWCLGFLVLGFLCGFIQDRNRRALMVFLTFISVVLVSMGMISLLGGPNRASGFEYSAWSLGASLVFHFICLGVVLIPLFRKFDLRVFGLYEKRILFLVLPVLALIDGAVLVGLFL